MKLLTMVARYLMGAAFVLFGLNGFFHFMPMGAPMQGPAGQFMGAMVATHYPRSRHGLTTDLRCSLPH